MKPAIRRYYDGLYAAQQYWCLRECGYPDRMARTYIERKWKLTLPKKL